MLQKEKVDWLVIGAHPDDAEIGAGGFIIQQAKAGKKIVLCDLTAGEMSSNGEPVLRNKEALDSARLMGVSERICLKLKDRGLKKSDEEIERLVQVIRRYSPEFILCPYHLDTHPDHRQASELVREAVFNARLTKYGEGNITRVARVWEYFINEIADHPVYVRLTSEIGQMKMQALACYHSQFEKDQQSVPTRLHSVLEKIERRDRYLGDIAGAPWAEGFFQREEIAVHSLIDLL